MKVTDLDHIVLTVRDIETSADFYVSVPGMNRESFGQGEVRLRFSRRKLNLHRQGSEFEPKTVQPQPGKRIEHCGTGD